MFHLINQNNEYLKKIEFLKKIGLKTIIIMDSAGCLIPADVKNIFSSLKKFKINFGFHAHNNLGCAIWNTVEAYDNGANILDASIRGFGAGAGNAQLEVLLTILKKRKENFFNNFDISRIYEMSDKFKSLLESNDIKYNNAFSQPPNILSANYGLFSGFASQVNNFSERFKVSKLKAFEAIGKKKLVAGQEDLIMNVIFNLSNKKKNNIDIK
jgi:4-hydroxy 2-oxovalerate aldolase